MKRRRWNWTAALRTSLLMIRIGRKWEILVTGLAAVIAVLVAGCVFFVVVLLH